MEFSLLFQIANWGCGNESVMDSIYIAEQYAKSKGRDDPNAWKLYIRRDLFPPRYDPSTDPVATDLTFAQIVGAIHMGEYKCDDVRRQLLVCYCTVWCVLATS